MRVKHKTIKVPGTNFHAVRVTAKDGRHRITAWGFGPTRARAHARAIENHIGKALGFFERETRKTIRHARGGLRKWV